MRHACTPNWMGQTTRASVLRCLAPPFHSTLGPNGINLWLGCRCRSTLPAAWRHRPSADVPDLVTTADLDGRFKLENVPLGRHALQVSFIGYEARVLEGIVVTSSRPAC